MPENTKHTIETPFMAQMPYAERLKEFKSYLWDCLTDTALMLNHLGEPHCQIIDHLNRMAACGEFNPCVQCGASQTSTHNTECAESATVPDDVTPLGGISVTGTLRLISKKDRSGR